VVDPFMRWIVVEAIDDRVIYNDLVPADIKRSRYFEPKSDHHNLKRIINEQWNQRVKPKAKWYKPYPNYNMADISTDSLF